MIKQRECQPYRSSCVVDALEPRRLFAFGLTTTTTAYTVDTGAGVVFSILRGGSLTSTIHLGDMTSVKFNGVEQLATYQQTSRYSHYEQGLTSGAKISATVDPAGEWVKITCDDSAAASGGVIQYYVAKKGDNNIYMASLPTDVNNGPGEGRYLAYLSKARYTNIEPQSDISTTNAVVEGSDVFVNTTTGITKSKYFAPFNRRMIDNAVHGVTGPGSGAFMFMGNRERSASGPFFKDIDFQTTGGATEIYNVLFSGHVKTEPFRQGLQGPYALQFTNGSPPATPNYAFLEGVGLSGLIGASARGAVAGQVSGVPAGTAAIVGLSNGEAQYWAYANAATGAYSISGVLPGTYTETLYANEMIVGTRSIVVTAGSTTQANVASTYYTPAATWRIGAFDGTPGGLLNADKIAQMHPSDVRMGAWTLPALPTVADPAVSLPTFVVGTDADNEWPMAQFVNVNNANRIQFNLTAAQAAQAHTLRIGITLGFEGGRNRVTVNAGQPTAWTSAIPAASRDFDERGVTRGTYRGENQLYTYNIPVSALRAGVNTIDLPVVSGSSGSGFLSPNVTYDAIDLVPTAALTNAPRATTLAISPTTPVLPNAARTFAAAVRDQFGAAIAANVEWSAARGTIDELGNYVAPATPGPDTVTATVGTLTVTTTINVLLAGPGKRLWYKADATAGATLDDASGNNLTATLNGSTASVPGQVGNALRLTGGHATLPNNVVSGLDDFTIGGWVKPDSNAAADTWARVFDFGTGTNNYMFLTPRASTGTVRFAILTAGGVEQQLNGRALPAGVWTHLAVTLRGSTATLYVNGQAVATNAAMTARPSALGVTTQNYLGKSQFAGDPAFLGNLDDLRLYNTGLPAADIAAWHAESTARPTLTGVVVNDNTPQRSMVRGLTLSFDRPVALSPAALSLLKDGVAADVTVAVAAVGTAGTTYRVTFAGPATQAGSLTDGRYRLTVNGTLVATPAGLTMASSPSYDFHRLFGDSDGDARVSFDDFVALQTVFGQPSTAASASAFDYDNDGVIDFDDFTALQTNFARII